MNGSLQTTYRRLRRFWERYVQPSSLETDPAFRSSLTETMHVGLWWGGGALLCGVAAHLCISLAVWGGTLSWTYSASGSGEIALLYDLLVSVGGVGLMALSKMKCSLSVGRFVGGIVAMGICGLSMHDDLLQGPSVAVEFVAMMYMGVAVTVPFRPWQMLSIGGGILGLYVLFTGTGLFVPAGVVEATSVWEAVPFLAMTIVGGMAICSVLYATRWSRHRVRREAEEELRAAKERAEAALETVEEQADQLRELDDMKSRFFANISHELRTPLSLMIGPVRQLLDHGDRPERETEMLRIVHRNATRLERLVEQLLELARYDAGRLDLNPQRQAWGAFVEKVTRRLTPMAEAQDVVLSVDTGEADRAVVFDPDHMETVVANLVRNALAYTPEEGTVGVRATVTAENEARLVVMDNGPGISEEEQEMLFERYYRGADQARLGGTGIGLALTKRLVDLHEGRIEVDSTLGEGSTFRVQLSTPPESEAPASATELPGGTSLPEERRTRASLETEVEDGLDATGDSTAAEHTGVDRTTILVVEDNADVRQYVRRLLEPNYRVLEAEHGREGLERARSALPDLVVADVMMPELNGFEMLRALRRSRRTDCIPVVMLTARADEVDQVEGLEGGAEAYVTKPFDAEVLSAQIARLIKTRRQLRERFEEEETKGAEASAPKATPESFEERVRTVVRAHLADPDLSVERLAEEVGCARRTVTRRMKDSVGQTPSQFIRTIRVERAAELLDEEAGTVSEIAYAVGFNSLSYFSRSFKEHFGRSPSAYQAERAH